ncbi:hypothetical protein RJG79_08065 [Mycoplasmatota bacterium WC44]
MEKNIRIINRLFAITLMLILLFVILGYIKLVTYIYIGWIGVVFLNYANVIYDKKSDFRLLNLFAALVGTLIVLLFLFKD